MPFSLIIQGKNKLSKYNLLTKQICMLQLSSNKEVNFMRTYCVCTNINSDCSLREEGYCQAGDFCGCKDRIEIVDIKKGNRQLVVALIQNQREISNNQKLILEKLNNQNSR